MTDYLVAAIHRWNEEAFQRHTPDLPGTWHLITEPESLTPDTIRTLEPRYAFFPHWSWKVPEEILEATECVCFHMTDVPYGRGGSPLQNLIVRGHRRTKLSALRMVDALDAGPVYAQCDLDLSGSAQEIYERAALLVYDLVAEIVSSEPDPRPQEGKAEIFPRRTPAQSALPAAASLEQLYDHIRMLDAETYPPAFLDHHGFRLEFRNAVFTPDGLEATVTIRATENTEDSE